MKLIGNGGIRPLESPESRCKRWQVWQYVEVDKHRSQRTTTYVGGKRGARARLEQFRAELADEIPNEDTLRAYCDRWLAWAEDFGNYSPETLRDYRAYLRAVCSIIGGERLDAITPTMCKDALSEMKHGKSLSGRKLSGATLAAYYKALMLVMQTASSEGAIASNPLDSVPPPRVDTAERQALTPTELDELWHKVRALPMSGRRCALLCAIDTGMRRGELCNELASDAGKVIVVSKSKTPAGEGRVLPLTDRLRDALADWKQYKIDQDIKSRWLFCEHDGSQIAVGRLGQWATGQLARLGYDNMTLHLIRHSNLSKMARYMGAHDLQRWAGWNSLKPAARYVHDDFGQLEAAVRRSQIAISPRNVANMLHSGEDCENAAV